MPRWRRARVSATAEVLPEPRVTLSGPDGKYALTDLPAGSYTISVTRTGFAPQTYAKGRAITPTPIEVAAGQQVANVDFALQPGGFIAGRILDEDGAPFAGAVVDALITRSDNGTDTLFSVSTSQTDDRGEFRLFGLAPGNYYVSAADPAFRAVSTPKGVLHYSPTYFPGVSFADQARQIVLTGSGDPPKVEFRLKLVPPARVSGQLSSSDGRQLFSAAIIMSPVEGEGAPMVPPADTRLLPDGHFSFGEVVPGHYQIRARGQTDAAGAALFAVFSRPDPGHRRRGHPDDAAARPDARRPAGRRQPPRHQAAGPADDPRPRAVHRRQQLRRFLHRHGADRRQLRASRTDEGLAPGRARRAPGAVGREERALPRHRHHRPAVRGRASASSSATCG